MIIQLNQVRFSYKPTRLFRSKNHHQTIQIDNWGLDSGETVFVHGPSGCGKSTLLNLLNGSLAADTGSISVLGQPLHQMGLRQRDRFRATHIGVVFQQFNLIPYLSAYDNIRLATQFAKGDYTEGLKTRIVTLLEALNIEPKDWRRATRELSIGQKQRVAIARALINQPQLLLADEPTSSLDQNNRDAFMGLLLDMANKRDVSVVCVSHDKDLAKFFDRSEAFTEINSPALTEENV